MIPIMPTSLEFLRPIQTLGYDTPYTLNYSSDSSRIALVTPSQTCFVDANTLIKERCYYLLTPNDNRQLIKISPDLQTVVYVPLEGTLKGYSFVAERELFSVKFNDDLNELSYSSNGKLFGASFYVRQGSSIGNQFRLYQTIDGSIVKTFEGQRVAGNPFSSDNKYITLVEGKNQVKVYSLPNGDLVKAWNPNGTNLSQVAYSPDGQFLALVLNGDIPNGQFQPVGNGLISVYHLPDFNLVWSTSGYGPVRSIIFSPNSQMLAFTSQGFSLTVYSTSGWTPFKTLTATPPYGYGNLFFSPDGHWLVATTGPRNGLSFNAYDRSAYLWDLTTGELAAKFPDQGDLPIAFSPDSHFVSYFSDYTFDRVDLATRKVSISKSASVGKKFIISTDGKLIISSGAGGEIYVWNSDDGQLLRTLGKVDRTKIGEYGSPVYQSALAISSDGRLIASSSNSGLIQLWDATSSTAPFQLLNRQGSLRGLAFSPDGKLLAATIGQPPSRNQNVYVWSVSDQRLVLTLPVSAWDLNDVFFSKDGSILNVVLYEPTENLYAVSGCLNKAEPYSISENCGKQIGQHRSYFPVPSRNGIRFSFAAFSPAEKRLFVVLDTFNISTGETGKISQHIFEPVQVTSDYINYKFGRLVVSSDGEQLLSVINVIDPVHGEHPIALADIDFKDGVQRTLLLTRFPDRFEISPNRRYLLGSLHYGAALEVWAPRP
jgi:WD40 repeat protein